MIVIDIKNTIQLLDNLYVKIKNRIPNTVFIYGVRDPIVKEHLELYDDWYYYNYVKLCHISESNKFISNEIPFHSLESFRLLTLYIDIIIRDNISNKKLLWEDDFNVSKSFLISVTNETREDIICDFFNRVSYSFIDHDIENVINLLDNLFSSLYVFYDNTNNDIVFNIEDNIDRIVLKSDNIYKLRYEEMLNAKRETY